MRDWFMKVNFPCVLPLLHRLVAWLIDPISFRCVQKTAWEKSIAATREKIGLSQSRFARLLGISVRSEHTTFCHPHFARSVHQLIRQRFYHGTKTGTKSMDFSM
jgi:hypothetical protein